MNEQFSVKRRDFLRKAATASVIGSLPLIPACSASRGSYITAETGVNKQSPYVYWTDIVLQAARDKRLAPLRSSRTYAMSHLAGSLALGNTHCGYETLAASAPENLNQAIAYGVAFSRTCEEALTRSLMLPRQHFLKTTSDDNRSASIAWGEKVADAVIQSRIRDGAQDSQSLFYPAHYTKRSDDLAWSPTGPFYSAKNGPAFQSFERGLRPGWGAQTTWCIPSVSHYDALPFPHSGSAEFKRQFEKVVEIGAGDSSSRTAEESEIALFWEDGPRGITVPGHFQLLALQVLGKLNLSFKQQTKFLATFSLAQADAAIVAWHNKYATDIIRPETAIRFADTRFQSPHLAQLKDPKWRSFIPTPPFPTYISGHSIIGAASTEILALMVGTDKVSLTSTSPDQVNWRQLKGVTRSWQSLRAIAEENGISREYGGVHWEIDNTEGLRLGYQLAKDIYDLDYAGKS